MKRLKRNEEGVSPVIATILMVAITVVLAATLYMMVGDFGGDGDMPLTASISIDDYETTEDNNNNDNHLSGLDIYFSSVSEPSSIDVDDLDLRVIYDDEGTEEAELDIDEDISKIGADGDDIVTGTTIFIEDINDDIDDIPEEGLDRVELRVDGYDGSTSASF